VAELEIGRLRSAQRLAAYLDSIAEPAGEPAVLAVRLAVSKTLVAARLGIKKENAVASPARVRKRRADRGFRTHHRHPRRRRAEADRRLRAGRERAVLIWINGRLAAAATLAQ
jgi:hypothetical protein